MKKILIGMGIVVSLFAVSGFGFTEISEYFQVARNNLKQTVKGTISNDVELDRLDLIVRKLNLQISKHKIKVAEAEVAFENAQQAWQSQVDSADGLKKKLADLRDIQQSMDDGQVIKVGCHSVSIGQIRAALAKQLQNYKNCRTLCEQKGKLMRAQEKSLAALKEKFRELQSQRDLLAQKIEILRSRNEVQKAQAAVSGNVELDDTELSRARKLAGEIENRLNVGSKVIALDQESGSILSQVTNDDSNLIAEVDQILGDAEAGEPKSEN